MGYAMGHAVANPMATRLVTQVLVFVIFGFAPVLFLVQLQRIMIFRYRTNPRGARATSALLPRSG